MKQNDEITYIRTDNLLDDSCAIIEAARTSAFRAVNVAMVQRNWLLGKRIAEEELAGKERAEYGTETIQKLSNQLTVLYGKGFELSTLYQYVKFYKFFPEIFHTCVENLSCSLGHTIVPSCKCLIRRLVTGMPVKRRNRLGAFAHYWDCPNK